MKQKKLTLLFSFLFFFFILISFNSVNAYVFHNGLENMTVNLNASFGNKNIDFQNDNFTAYDFENCMVQPSMDSYSCSYFSYDVFIQNFLRQKTWGAIGIYGTETFNSSVIISIRDDTQKLIARREISNILNFAEERNESCGTLFSPKTCTYDNRSMMGSLYVSPSLYPKISLEIVFIVSRVKYYTDPILGFKYFGGGDVENIIYVNTLQFESKHYIKSSVNTTVAPINSYFQVTTNYGTYNLTQNACVKIKYDNHTVECSENNYTGSSINIKSESSNPFDILVVAKGMNTEGNIDINRQWFNFNNFTASYYDNDTEEMRINTSIPQLINSNIELKPYICEGVYYDTEIMKETASSDLCSYLSRTMTKKNSGIPGGNVAGTGGDQGMRFGYMVYNNFKSDFNVSDDIKIYGESLESSTDTSTLTYLYAVSEAGYDLGVKTFGMIGSSGGSLVVSMNVYKNTTPCNSGYGSYYYKLKYGNINGIKQGDSETFALPSGIKTFCSHNDAVGDNWGSFFGTVTTTNKLSTTNINKRSIKYGKSTTFIIKGFKNSNNRMTTYSFSSPNTIYDIYNSSIINDNNYFTTIITGNTSSNVALIEKSIYSNKLSAKLYDYGISNISIATALIDDGSIILDNFYDINFKFFDADKNFEEIKDISLKIGDYPFIFVNTSSVIWNLLADNYSVSGYKMNYILHKKEKIAEMSILNVNEAKDFNVFFFNAYDLVSNFTSLSLLVYDKGLSNSEIEYNFNLTCEDYTKFDSTINKRLDIVIANSLLPNRNSFNCNVILSTFDNKILKISNVTVLKDGSENFYVFDITNLSDIVIVPQSISTLNDTANFFGGSATGLKEFSLLFWNMLTVISDGNKTVLAFMVILITVVLLNFAGDKDQKIPVDMQEKIIGAEIITLILLGLIDGIIGVLLLIVIGLLTAKKFNLISGSNSGDE